MAGKVGAFPIVEIPSGGIEYFQAVLTVRDENTLVREIAPLNSINNHNAKYLLTLDEEPEASHNGIRQITPYNG
jgi:hypothetical protein